MTIPSHLKSIKYIRLRTLRMIHGSAVGDNATKQASSTGFEFDSLRVYEQGDDVRRIDWNSSVRSGALMVRSFREQRNRTIIIMLDISASMATGSSEQLKCTIMHIVAHSIGLAAEASRDALGICFTNNDIILEYIRPRIGKTHVMHCIQAINRIIENLSQRKNSEELIPILKYGDIGMIPRHAWVICITDGLIKEYEAWWKTLALRRILTIVRVRDRYEKSIPTFCVITCYDPENSAKKTHRLLANTLQEQSTTWYQKQLNYTRKLGTQLLDIIAGEPYENLVRLFFEQGTKL
jgi:uncharacterized protein (DUF58 family)